MIKTFLSVVLVAAAGSAQALTYTAVNGAPDPGVSGASQVFVNFDDPIASTGFTFTGNYALATGTTQNAAAPAGDATQYAYVSPALATNSATLTSPFNLAQIGFYWGSVDKYNSVDVLGSINGGATQTLYTLSGGAIPPSNGDQQAASTNDRVTFTAGSGEAITGLRFVSTGVAFEVDDVAGRLIGDGSASAVPEPASWALLVAGFGVVGAVARRRRTATSVAA